MVAYLDSADPNMHSFMRIVEHSFFKGGLLMKTTQGNTRPTSFQDRTPSLVFLSDIPKTFRTAFLREASE